MRFIPALAFGLALLSPAALAADLLAAMQGEWQGESMILSLDFERDQARIDPARPFAWQRLSVKSIEGRRAVFAVGTRIFTATLDGDVLSVKPSGSASPQLLRRVVGEPDATSSIGGTDAAESVETSPPEAEVTVPDGDPDAIAAEAEANDDISAGPQPDAAAEAESPAAAAPGMPLESSDRLDDR